jgi:hypothetical protein
MVNFAQKGCLDRYPVLLSFIDNTDLSNIVSPGLPFSALSGKILRLGALYPSLQIP